MASRDHGSRRRMRELGRLLEERLDEIAAIAGLGALAQQRRDELAADLRETGMAAADESMRAAAVGRSVAWRARECDGQSRRRDSEVRA